MGEYKLPHMGGVTIPARLTAIIIAELKSGKFKNSERLPSEVELAAEYKVSRSVIRDVMSDLEREGFVSRGRGVGTIIHRYIVNLKTRVDLKYEYNSIIEELGARPGIGEVRLFEKKADEILAKQLEIKEGAAVVACEKHILADGKVVIFSTDHMAKEIFGGKDYTMFNWDMAVFDILEKHYGIVSDTDIASFSAVNADEYIGAKMGVPIGKALMKIGEVGYYRFSKPIFQTTGYYTDFFGFSVLRKMF